MIEFKSFPDVTESLELAIGDRDRSRDRDLHLLAGAGIADLPEVDLYFCLEAAFFFGDATRQALVATALLRCETLQFREKSIMSNNTLSLLNKRKHRLVDRRWVCLR